MKTLLVFLSALSLPLLLLAAPVREKDSDEPKGDKVTYQVHKGHFVKNTYKLKADSAYLALTSRAAFDQVFGIAATMNKQAFVPQDAFEKHMVVAVIKRGNAITEYQVQDVRADDKTLYVRYTTHARGANANATFASPLIVVVKKHDYSTVVFIENGKKAEQVKVEK